VKEIPTGSYTVWHYFHNNTELLIQKARKAST